MWPMRLRHRCCCPSRAAVCVCMQCRVVQCSVVSSDCCIDNSLGWCPGMNCAGAVFHSVLLCHVLQPLSWWGDSIFRPHRCALHLISFISISQINFCPLVARLDLTSLRRRCIVSQRKNAMHDTY